MEIFHLVPHTPIDKRIQSRAERALLPFMADISKSLFGTARQKDLILLQNHIKTLTTHYNADQAIIQDSVNEMTSFMATANERFDNAFQGIQENHDLLLSLANSVQSSLSERLDLLLQIFDTLLLEMGQSQKISQSCDNLVMGVQELMRNKLSPYIISPSVLMNTLQHTDKYLQTHNGYSLVTTNPSYYYRTATVAYQRHHSSIYININIPIALTKITFHVFEILSFPIALNSHSGHATQLLDLPPYLAVNVEENFYISLKESQYRNCHGNSIKHCSTLLPVKDFKSLTCEMGIFLQHKSDILSLCDFRFLPTGVQSFVMELSPNSYLVSNASSMLSSCSGTPVVNHPGCTLCVLNNIPCHCTMKVGDFHIAARISDCDKNSKQLYVSYPVNLALLSHFFEEHSLQDIASDTRYTTPLSPDIPDFNIYEHNFSKIVANDKSDHLSLNTMVQQTKKNNQIYQSLTHTILSEQWIPTKQTFQQLFIKSTGLVSLFLNIVLLVLLGILAFRFRRLAIIVSLLVNKPSPVHSLTPPYLQWTVPSSRPPPTTAQCQCLESPWMFLISSIIFFFLALHLCQCLCKIKSTYDTHAIFCLEFRNTASSFLLDIASLPTSISPWKLCGSGNVSGICIQRDKFLMTCLLNWNDLYMTNDSLNTTVTLQKKIHLMPIMFLRLRKMLSTEYQVYFCVRQYNAITRLTPLSSDSNKQSVLYPQLSSTTCALHT